MQMQGELELELELPPGFRFHPTDDELVNHYLCRKCAAQSIAVPIIKEIDLYKFDPWHLPEMGGGNGNGEKEWYFFSPRDRKYPNGSRPNRAAGNGYWKATGADKAIGKLGIKKALVFYAGKAPKGVKTNWIMHEYRLANVDRSQPKKINNLRLDDWVLCRIYNKKGKIEKYDNSVSVDQKAPPPQQIKNDMYNQIDFRNSQLLYQIDSSDYSSCSVSPDVNKEVQSEPKWNELELELGPAFDFHFNFMDNNDDINMPSDDDPFAPPFQINHPSPFQDILMFFQHS